MDIIIAGLIILLVGLCYSALKRTDGRRTSSVNSSPRRRSRKTTRPSSAPTSFPNDDVLKGYRFNASLLLVTPAAVLQRHGELWTGSPKAMPSYGTVADGIWLPETKGWADLAEEAGNLETARRLRIVETDEPRIVATDIGPQPNDGRDYCKFLLAFRRIVESSVEKEDKDRLIQQLLDSDSAYRTFAEKHDRDFVSNWHRIVAKKQSKRARRVKPPTT